MIQTQCDGCFREYRLDDKYAGKRIRCKACGTVFTVVSTEALPLPEMDHSGLPSPPRPGKPQSASRKAGRKKSSSNAWIWWAVGGGLLTMLLLCCGGLFLAVRSVGQALESASQPELSLGDPNDLFPLADVPVPQFPELGEPRVLQPSGVRVHFLDFASVPANGEEPGMRMKLRLYIPPGEHPPGSLGCVVVAPAGTNLLTGCELDADDYHDETLPYAEAGMVVVFYTLDGGLVVQGDDSQIRDAYLAFRAARAGVLNGRNAIDFVLSRLPEVDPQRIFAAGHSSAGTVALLLAAHEPRLRGCLAYAPVTDVEEHLGEAVTSPVINFLLPGISDFVRQSSPKTHVTRFHCPIFLLHARDDSTVPFSSAERFAELLAANGKPHVFSVADSGDHYDSMIQEGIPRGIEWIREGQAVQGQPAVAPP